MGYLVKLLHSSWTVMSTVIVAIVGHSCWEPTIQCNSFLFMFLPSIFLMMTLCFCRTAGTIDIYYYEIRDTWKSTSFYTLYDHL